MKNFLTLIPLVILFFTSGCIPESMMLKPLPEDPRTPAVIAAFLPLSGENRIYAEQMKEGLLFAETEINSRNGINGKQIKVIFYDTNGSAAGTLEAVSKAEQDNAVAAIAGYSTTEVSNLVKYAAPKRMPMIIPMATSDYHLQAGAFVCRNSFSDTQQMEVLANYLIHWRKTYTGAVITDYDGDREYARGITRNFIQAVSDNGGTISSSETIGENGMISREQLVRLLATDPRFILVAAQGKRAALLLKKLREAGFSGIICGPDSWDQHEFISHLAGSEPGECIFTAFFHPENDSRAYLEFHQKFRKKFFHNPGACETQSYDALNFLCIALSNAEHILDFDRNWRTIRNHSGAAALYTGLPGGGIDRTIYLKSIGIDRSGEKTRPYARLSKKLQHSDLKKYRIIE